MAKEWLDLIKEELEAIEPKGHEGYIHNEDECERCQAIRAALRAKNKDFYG